MITGCDTMQGLRLHVHTPAVLLADVRTAVLLWDVVACCWNSRRHWTFGRQMSRNVTSLVWFMLLSVMCFSNSGEMTLGKFA